MTKKRAAEPWEEEEKQEEEEEEEKGRINNKMKETVNLTNAACLCT